VCSFVFDGVFIPNYFTEGFRDTIFNTEIVAALAHTLGHEDLNIRTSVVKFFTSALAQGVLCCFDGIFMSIHSQRGFGTRYLILRWLPHLDVH